MHRGCSCGQGALSAAAGQSRYSCRENRALSKISQVHLGKNSSSVLKINLKISSECNFSVESEKCTVAKETFLVFGLPLTPKDVSFNSEHVCIDLLCVCTSAT